MINKRGQIFWLLMFFTVVAIIMAVGFFIAIGGSVIDIAVDEIVPEVQGIGMVGDSNVSAYADYAVTPLNSVLQSYTWMGGLFYAIGIIGLFAISAIFRISSNKFLIVLFVGFSLLFLMLGIFMSNMYEGIYTGTDELATRLQSQTILSFLMLNSPLIFTVVIFICGIIMFTGVNEEEYA